MTQKQFERAVTKGVSEATGIPVKLLCEECGPCEGDMFFLEGVLSYNLELLPLCDRQRSMASFTYDESSGELIVVTVFTLIAEQEKFEESLQRFEETEDAQVITCDTEPYDDDREEGFLNLCSRVTPDGETAEAIAAAVAGVLAYYGEGSAFDTYIVPFIKNE